MPDTLAASYVRFVRSKRARAVRSGFAPAALHPSLFPHQRDAVEWMCAGGRRALFFQFGMGKTRIQIEALRQALAAYPAGVDGQPSTASASAGPALVVLPLGVRAEFEAEAERMDVPIRYVRTDAEAAQAVADGVRLHTTNYERVRDGQLSAEYCAGLSAVSLDEASVLRSFGSKTYHTFNDLFGGVPLRYVATATPAPNRLKELIHYAGFLGVMDTGQALTRFFQRNSERAGDLTLMPHMEDEFWKWVGSWALYATRPSDLDAQYSDAGYDLPEIDVQWHTVAVDHTEGAGEERDGQARLFRSSALGVRDAAREKRDTLTDRLDRAIEIVASGPADRHWVIWHHLEDERRAIEAAAKAGRLPEMAEGGTVTAYGSQDLEARESAVVGFAKGAYRVLATKPSIAGSGCNLQAHCADVVFLGLDYSFNDFIQAVHRVHRFGQTRPVTVHVVTAESESAVVASLRRKWALHEDQGERMRETIRRYGLSGQAHGIDRASTVDRREASGPTWHAVLNDCVTETATMPDESVGMILTSVPFSDQYEYTPSLYDFGYNAGDGPFFDQMAHLVPELHRVLRPGRVCAVHVKDRVRFARVTGKGAPTVSRFSDATADAFEAGGFAFFGRITIATDVVRENNQTYRLGWTEMCKDGTKMGCGMSEYVLLFRRLPTDTSDGYADVPVSRSKQDYTRARWQTDAAGFWRSSGDRLLTPDEIAALTPSSAGAWWREYHRTHVYDHEAHVGLAEGVDANGALPSTFALLSPQAPEGVAESDNGVWTDVVRMRTLNTEQAQRREEQHVCPLQLDVVDRLIRRFSAEGDVVFDPFGGLGTVPYQAIKSGRRGLMTELNPEYWRTACGYLRAAEVEAATPSLFDALQVPGDGAASPAPEEAASGAPPRLAEAAGGSPARHTHVTVGAPSGAPASDAPYGGDGSQLQGGDQIRSAPEVAEA